MRPQSPCSNNCGLASPPDAAVAACLNFARRVASAHSGLTVVGIGAKSTPARCNERVSSGLAIHTHPDIQVSPAKTPHRFNSRSARRGGGRRRSEEHTSELQSLMRISYAVFCLKKKKNIEHTKA